MTTPPPPTQSPVLIEEKSKKLKYVAFQQHGETNRVHKLPDFSFCGYKGGGISIPDVFVVKKVSPNNEDDRSTIQTAIDEISKLKPNEDGFRGTLVFTKGTYRLSGSLRIKKSGIILRGESSETTTLVATKAEKHPLIHVQGPKVKMTRGKAVLITQDVVPMGASSVRVASSDGFGKGDWIVVSKNPDEKWISNLDMAQYGWKAEDYKMEHIRQIESVDSKTSTIYFDMPLSESIDQRYGGGTVSLLPDGPMTGLVEVGIENLRLVSEHRGEFDEEHGWQGIMFRDCSNCWVRDTVVEKFGYAAVHLKGLCFQISVQDVAMLDPKSKIEGGRRYCFCVDAPSSRILFQRCFARNGRHSFVSGARVPGPIVFTHCVAVSCHNDDGPHHRYSVGQLYDNIDTSQLSVQNRRHSGTGHGWTGNCIVFWACKIRDRMICETPKSGMNFAISCQGKLGRGVWKPAEPLGFLHAFRNLSIKNVSAKCCPRSLYLSQLEARLGTKALEATTTKEQRLGTIWTLLRNRFQEGGEKSVAVSLTPRVGSSVMYDIKLINRSKSKTLTRAFVKLELSKDASEVKSFGGKIESLKKVGSSMYQFWINVNLEPGEEYTTGFKICGSDVRVKRIFLKKTVSS